MSVWFSCENEKIEKKKLGQGLPKFKKVMFQYCKVEIWVNPGQFSFFVFSMQLTENRYYKDYRWVDSNRGPPVSEATAQPTEPQSLL